MIHLGDITKISGYDVPIVDCIIGGSPCQDLSVAGKRAGLDGERSGLFMEQIRIVKEMREKDERNGASEHIRPRFLIWENVPGSFSSQKGEDFRIVLEEIVKIVDKDAVIPRPPKNKWTTSGSIVGDGWSIAWRVCDAQFWGVPQRRRRIALVADFGGQCASEILFVRKGLSGYPSESRTERKRTSQDAEGCLGADDSKGKSEEVKCYDIGDRRSVANESVDVCPTLLSKMGTGGNNVPVVIEGIDCYNQALTGDVTMTMTARKTDSHHIPCVVMDRAACYCLQGNGIDRADTANQNGCGFREGTSYTLNSVDRPAVAYNGADIYNLVVTGDRVNTLTAEGYTSTGTSPKVIEVIDKQEPYYIVRRLTPLECERLQGFPDYWTDIGEYVDGNGKKKKSSDAARYKALGNSIALPSWKWVLKRLCSHYERDATMASLFDGIGGFPHLWEQINGKGSCLWASEIEDFPIAVTSKQIG